jgi:hypothetical protein
MTVVRCCNNLEIAELGIVGENLSGDMSELLAACLEVLCRIEP